MGLGCPHVRKLFPEFCDHQTWKLSLYTEFIFILISNHQKSHKVIEMRKILFLLSRAFADIVWNCEAAANLCLNAKTFIPKKQICQKPSLNQDTTCLDQKYDLCKDSGHQFFETDEYTDEFCKQGGRSDKTTTDWVKPLNKLNICLKVDCGPSILEAQTSDRKKILNFRPFYSNEWAGVGGSNAER